MQEHPLVSIVIPVYNGATYMREAIDSALAQTYPNIEILVVNDGSTDDTREIALSYGDRIRYFEKENGGVSTALNLGIREMEGAYFSWLSHDDVYYPDKIQAEIEALHVCGDVNMAVYCDWDLWYMPSGTIQHTSFGYSNRYMEIGIFPVLHGMLYGCTLLIPKNYFLQYGLFDETLKAAQDNMKWYEMFHDKRIVYIPRSLLKERRHDKQVTKTYGGFLKENAECFRKMIDSMDSKCIENMGLNIYTFYSAMSVWMLAMEHRSIRDYLHVKIKEMEEPIDADIRCSEFSSWLNSFGGKRISLYGAGKYGLAFAEALDLRGIGFHHIVDSDPKKWGMQIGSHKCMSPSELDFDDLIIVAMRQTDDIVHWLRSKGYTHILTYKLLEERLLSIPIKKKLLYKSGEYDALYA